MASKDPRVRQAACMVRAMKACCPLPRGLPAQPVLRVAAWELRLELPEALRRRDVKRLALATGLAREYSAALIRSFPDAKAVDRLECCARLMLDGLPPRLAPAAYDAWQEDAPHRLGRDPYGALYELKGTLDEADAVAKPTFEQRVAGHARWALRAAARDGHTMLPTLAVLARLRGHGDVDAVRRALVAAVDAGQLALVGAPDADEGIADPEVLRVEAGVAAEIKKRVGVSYLPEVDLSGSGLTDAQIQAAGAAFASALSVLTGGPGTGKSTVVKALLQAVGEHRCLLTAPTGRAARNVGGNTVHSASGGRLLKRRPLQETTRADVPDDLLLLVVDEVSMLDTELMAGVLSLAPPRCHVLLVGDADQLPPVGAGNVLRDLLAAGGVPVGRLRHNHRCSGRVQALAAAVLAGDVGGFEFDDGDDGVVLVEAKTAGEAVRLAVGEAVRRQAQVLTPQNAPRAVLNRAVQSAVRPGGVGVVCSVAALGVSAMAAGTMKTDDAGQATLRFGDKTLCMPVDEALSITRTPSAKETLLSGDLVMALKNQNKKRLGAGEVSACNGDVGVLRTALGKPTVSFGDDAVAEFPKAEGWLTLAYAATVHKFQGSECDSVVLPMAQGASLWDRELLYTAITRARSRVVLLGSRADLQAVAARARPRRHSLLRALLA